MDMAFNFYNHAKNANIKHVAIGGMDPEALDMMAERRVPCFPMRDARKSANEAIGWGGAAFKNLGVRKITLLIDLLELGVNVVLVDADTVLLRDPLPYFHRWPDADVLASTDHLTNSTDELGLEDLEVAHSHWNVGLFYLKASAVRFAHAWRELLIRKPHWWDQHAFGWLLRQGVLGDGKGPGSGGPNGPGWDLKGDKTGLSDRHLFRCFTNHSLVCGTLPVAQFANGHVGLVQRLHVKLNRPLYFVHATHQYSAGAGKRHRLREAMFWIDEPSYYDPPGGLLHAPLHLPDALLHPVGADGTPLFKVQKAFLDTQFNHSAHPALVAQFELAHYQIRHVRDGVAAAWALGRKLVLPPLACAFDRGPFPHVGKSPGAVEQVLPIYPCPLDYIFDIDRKPTPGAPRLLDVAREYSLLNNSRTPRAVLESVVRLPQLPAGETAQSLREKWESTKLVELAALPPAFGEGSLLSLSQQSKFQEALKLYTDVWCCVNPIRCARRLRVAREYASGSAAAPSPVCAHRVRARSSFPARARTRRGSCRARHVRRSLRCHTAHRPHAARVDVQMAHTRRRRQAALLVSARSEVVGVRRACAPRLPLIMMIRGVRQSTLDVCGFHAIRD
jgi:hypothetical protein